MFGTRPARSRAVTRITFVVALLALGAIASSANAATNYRGLVTNTTMSESLGVTWLQATLNTNQVAVWSLRRRESHRTVLSCEDPTGGIVPLDAVIHESVVYLLGARTSSGHAGDLCDRARQAEVSPDALVVLVSRDRGRSWSVISAPDPSSGRLIEGEDGVLYGSRAAGWWMLSPQSTWTRPSKDTVGSHPDAQPRPRGYRLQHTRPLQDGTTWAWWTRGQWGSTVFTRARAGRVIEHVRARVRIRRPHASSHPGFGCAYPSTGIARGLSDALASTTGRVVWGVTASTGFGRCGPMALFTTLAVSRDGGRHWRAVRAPGPDPVLVAVDGRAPVVAINRDCGRASHRPLYRRVGDGWRSLGCQPLDWL